jgi:hypothetical protein
VVAARAPVKRGARSRWVPRSSERSGTASVEYIESCTASGTASSTATRFARTDTGAAIGPESRRCASAAAIAAMLLRICEYDRRRGGLLAGELSVAFSLPRSIDALLPRPLLAAAGSTRGAANLLALGAIAALLERGAAAGAGIGGTPPIVSSASASTGGETSTCAAGDGVDDGSEGTIVVRVGPDGWMMASSTIGPTSVLSTGTSRLAATPGAGTGREAGSIRGTTGTGCAWMVGITKRGPALGGSDAGLPTETRTGVRADSEPTTTHSASDWVRSAILAVVLATGGTTGSRNRLGRVGSVTATAELLIDSLAFSRAARTSWLCASTEVKRKIIPVRPYKALGLGEEDATSASPSIRIRPSSRVRANRPACSAGAGVAVGTNKPWRST